MKEKKLRKKKLKVRKSISIYEEDWQRLEKEAEEVDEKVSAYINNILKKHWDDN